MVKALATEMEMQKAKKQLQSRREEIIELVKAHPGITSAEIAVKLGLENSAKAATAAWPAIKRGQIVVERISKDGQTKNAHYHPDQVPPDAVERIQQKLVDASEVIPISKAKDARNSVFDVPRKQAARKSARKVPRRIQKTVESINDTVPTSRPSRAPSGFACAITNDGSLVLMRQGQVEFALSDAEAATLQSYLVKRATANLFASMAR